ncbi:MAG: HAD family phosphatase [Candidatus Omnitrophota bacterium]
MLEKKLVSVKAVIFDMDGVIVNTMPFHASAWQKTFKKFGINVTKKEIYLREGEKWDKTFYDIAKRHNIKITSTIKQKIFKHRQDVFRDMLKVEPRAQAHGAESRIAPRKRDWCGVELFKDAPPLIMKFKKMGLKLAIVTGTPRREVKQILPKSIYAIFDVIIPSDEVKNGKPHPEPFLKALERLKVSAKEAIVIENAPNGILAAKKAKLTVIAVETSLPKKYLKDADFILRSLSELL